MNDEAKKARAEAETDTEAETVADYLRRHPRFLSEHPELLTLIDVPHSTGQAVSLVERQVSMLRHKNELARQRLRELIDIARQNEELARRMHQLALSLMDAAEPKDIFATLYGNLREDFHTDMVAVRLFAEPAFVDTFAGEEFAGKEANEYALFRSIVERRTPLSGILKRQQQVFLFGDEGDQIASAVMVPLYGPGWGGILAIGSRDSERFQAAMGTDLLANLGEVLSFILKPWIKES